METEQIPEPSIDDLLKTLEHLRLKFGPTPNWTQRKAIRHARTLLLQAERRAGKTKRGYVWLSAGQVPKGKRPGVYLQMRRSLTHDDRTTAKGDAHPLPWIGNLYIDPETREHRGTRRPAKRQLYFTANNGSLVRCR